MIETAKKYVVNLDFPTAKREKGHKIHLNPYYEGSAFTERILRHYDPEKSKIPKDGGAVYLTRTEALECLKGLRDMKWQMKTASLFRSCRRCNRLPEWELELEC